MTDWDEETLARAVGMKRAGIPNAEIAKRLGVSLSTLYRHLRNTGAKRRLDGHGGGVKPMLARGALYRRISGDEE